MALLSPTMMLVWWRWLNKEEDENEDTDENVNVRNGNDDSLEEPLL